MLDICQSRGPQTGRCQLETWRPVMYWLESLVLASLPRSRERSIERLTDKNEPVQNSAPNRALELTIRSISENE